MKLTLYQIVIEHIKVNEVIFKKPGTSAVTRGNLGEPFLMTATLMLISGLGQALKLFIRIPLNWQLWHPVPENHFLSFSFFGQLKKSCDCPSIPVTTVREKQNCGAEWL